jgi:hypothetical protein
MKTVQLNELVSAIPVMTKKERLLYWANIVRTAPNSVELLNGLEHWTSHHLATVKTPPLTPFGLAASDPTFQKMGLGNTVKAAMEFFDLSVAQLHSFSCDCGGYVDNERMAQRITNLAR